MKAIRIDHMHIVVKDLDAATKRFADMFGTKWYGPREPKPGAFKVAFDNIGIEVLQPLSSDNFIAEHLDKYGEGTAWIGIKVENLDEAVAELRAKGISVEHRTSTDPSGRGDIHVASTTDPSQTFGVVFELLEYQDVIPACVANWSKIREIPKLI